MPANFGAGPYGLGNYSAATGFALTAAQGSALWTGEAATLSWQTRCAAGQGTQSLAGQGAPLSWQAAVSAAGLHNLAGQEAGFDASNIWTADPAAPGTWTPPTPENNSWTPARPGCQNWSER